MAEELYNVLSNLNLSDDSSDSDSEVDSEIENDSDAEIEYQFVQVHFTDGDTGIALFCPHCFCLIKRIDICHRCFADEGYWSEAEYQEHAEFVEKIDYVTALDSSPAA